jgi:hypothetical protein
MLRFALMSKVTSGDRKRHSFLTAEIAIQYPRKSSTPGFTQVSSNNVIGGKTISQSLSQKSQYKQQYIDVVVLEKKNITYL